MPDGSYKYISPSCKRLTGYTSSWIKNEKREIRKHSETGARLARFFPELHSIADYILMHHERYDGGGYPLSQKGAQIPMAISIISIAVAFIAMTIDRPFCRAMTTETAIAEIKRCASSQFDPILVDTLIELKFLKFLGLFCYLMACYNLEYNQ